MSQDASTLDPPIPAHVGMANPLDNEPDVSWGMFWSNVGMFAVAGLAAVYACRRRVGRPQVGGAPQARHPDRATQLGNMN